MGIVNFVTFFNPECSEASRREACVANLRAKLEDLNSAIAKEVSDTLETAVNNVMSGASYERLDPSGPQVGEI